MQEQEKDLREHIMRTLGKSQESLQNRSQIIENYQECMLGLGENLRQIIANTSDEYIQGLVSDCLESILQTSKKNLLILCTGEEEENMI